MIINVQRGFQQKCCPPGTFKFLRKCALNPFADFE